MEIDLGRLVDALPGLTWTATPEGGAEIVGKRWLEYTGLTAEEAAGVGWHQAVHPEDAARLFAEWAAIIASGRAGEVEARLRRFDGEYRWFLFRASPFAGEHGKVAGWCGINIDIEDRRRAEAAAHEQQRGFQRILDGLPAIVALFTPGGQLEFCNRQMLEYLGDSFVQFRTNPAAYIHHDEREEMQALWNSAVQSNEPFDYDARLRRADGEYRWHRTRCIPLRNAEGGVELWYALSTDLHDTKQAEAKLRRANGHLSEAQRLSKTGSFTTDLVKDEHIWSDELYRICELEPGSKITVEKFESLVHPEDLPAVRGVIEESIRGITRDFVFRMVTSQGAVKHLRTVAKIVEQVEGRFVLTGAMQDITKSKLAEEELWRAYAHLTEAQQLSKTGSFTADLVRDEHVWSDEFYRICEFEIGSKITIQKLQDIVHPEDVAQFRAAIEAALAGSEPSFLFRIVTPRGTVKHLRGLAKVTEEFSGRRLFVGAIQDITEGKVAEDALNRARAELAHVARIMTLGALTASIAHEVNQPLAGIVTNAGACLRMLGADPPNVDGARATAQRTIRDANRAAEVIERLRTLFKRKQHGAELVDLNDAVREVLVLSSSELQRSGVMVRTDFADARLRVRGDRVQLQQVMLNLIRNAAEAMSEIDDRPRAMLVTTAEDKAGMVRLSVRDSGIGIDPETVQRLFDPFYTTKIDGMGIGLSISRTIIESHEGRLWASVNEGPGATFSFSVPGETELPASLNQSPARTRDGAASAPAPMLRNR